ASCRAWFPRRLLRAAPGSRVGCFVPRLVPASAASCRAWFPRRPLRAAPGSRVGRFVPRLVPAFAVSFHRIPLSRALLRQR
ncbi:hypothetical protein, partial [Actinoplanes sp. NPDC049802]|uniref:hypothetical protein n=1 Tax=Actinoplanes sp. NPDC049802 TaxID=3154742 RepID=UPI0033CD0B3F